MSQIIDYTLMQLVKGFKQDDRCVAVSHTEEHICIQKYKNVLKKKKCHTLGLSLSKLHTTLTVWLLVKRWTRVPFSERSLYLDGRWATHKQQNYSPGACVCVSLCSWHTDRMQALSGAGQRVGDSGDQHTVVTWAVLNKSGKQWYSKAAKRRLKWPESRVAMVHNFMW